MELGRPIDKEIEKGWRKIWVKIGDPIQKKVWDKIGANIWEKVGDKIWHKI